MAELPTYTCQKIYMGNGKEASHFRKNISCRVFCFGSPQTKQQKNVEICLEFRLFRTDLSDLIHDLVGYFLIDGLQTFVGAVFGFFAQFFEFKRLSIADDDFDRFGEDGFPVVCFIRAKDADGDDGDVGLDNGQPDAGVGLLQISIRGACSFREEVDTASFFQKFEQGAETAHAAAVSVHGDRVDDAEDRSEYLVFKKGFAGKIMDRFGQGCSNEYRIQKAGMVAGDDGGTLTGNIFPVMDLPPEVDLEKDLAEQPD